MKSRIEEILESNIDFHQYSYSELGRMFNYDCSKLRKKLVEKGIVLNNGRKFNSQTIKFEKNKKTILDLVAEGLTINEIHNETNLGIRYIRTIMSDCKIPCNRLTGRLLKLRDYEESIIIGTILGDANISNDCFKSGESRLSIKHSIVQMKYLEYLVNNLPNVGKGNWNFQIVRGLKFKRVANNPDKLYCSVTWDSKSNVYFSNLRKRFYSTGIKSIPEDIKLDALSVAVWFMDDGSSTKYNSYFCTNSFTEADCKILQRELLKLNISTNIWTNGRKEPLIYIKAESILDFIILIRPYVTESMLYKLRKLNKWGIYCKLTGTPLELIEPNLLSNK